MGCYHPDYLTQYLTASQIGEWIAYAELEPFGAVHESKLIGQVCATIANFSQMEVKDEDTGKRKYWLPDEFVPDPLVIKEAKKKKVQTPEEMAAMLRTIPKSKKETPRKKRK